MFTPEVVSMNNTGIQACIFDSGTWYSAIFNEVITGLDFELRTHFPSSVRTVQQLLKKYRIEHQIFDMEHAAYVQYWLFSLLTLI
jgi:hypothetical protein